MLFQGSAPMQCELFSQDSRKMGRVEELADPVKNKLRTASPQGETRDRGNPLEHCPVALLASSPVDRPLHTSESLYPVEPQSADPESVSDSL